jgi:hypothetical protein
MSYGEIIIFLKGVDSKARRKNLNSQIESLDACELEDEVFSEGEINVGRAVASFNFSINNEDTSPIINKPTQTYKTTNRGLTLAVDGELYTVKRCYQFRQSTIRKLN